MIWEMRGQSQCYKIMMIFKSAVEVEELLTYKSKNL